MWGVPTRYIDRTFDTFDPQVSVSAARALAEARRFVEEQRGSLVLIGRPGCGKSHLAAAICHAEWEHESIGYREATIIEERKPLADQHWPRQPQAPQWTNVPDLIGRLRGGDDDVKREARGYARFPGVLVLDDLGREKVSEWTGEVLYVLVNTRYEERLRTVVTSNLSMEELSENGYGASLSRLAEDGSLLVLKSATDFRTRR
jgi:DNA replication protein DnaC